MTKPTKHQLKVAELSKLDKSRYRKMFVIYMLFDDDTFCLPGREIGRAHSKEDVLAMINNELNKLSCFDREHVEFNILVSDKDFFRNWKT